MKNIAKPFFTATALALGGVSTVGADTIKSEKLGSMDSVFGNLRGNYDRQDGVYLVTIPHANTNGEDLVCMVFKDTTVVYDLQMTPNTLAQGITSSCNWLPPRQTPQ